MILTCKKCKRKFEAPNSRSMCFKCRPHKEQKLSAQELSLKEVSLHTVKKHRGTAWLLPSEADNPKKTICATCGKLTYTNECAECKAKREGYTVAFLKDEAAACSTNKKK